MDGGDLSVHQDLNVRNIQSKWKQYIINLCMVLSMNGKKKYSKGKKRQRRIFYANNPKLYYTATFYNPDCIIFDLEDAIEISEKDAARDLLVEAIKSLDFYGVEIFVRVNSVTTPFFEEDIKEIVPVGIRKIRLSMCQSKEDIMILDKLLNAVETKHNIKLGSVKRNSKGYFKCCRNGCCK